ncbi:MAG: STAS domain-containing protein [Actinomycetota bacterium]
MNYKITQSADTVTVALDGKLNFASNEAFHTILDKVAGAKVGRVVFDLSSLASIDSVGLGLLFIANEDLGAEGARLCLKSPNGAVARLLELTDAGRTFEILP